jgi:hypothetical protein
MRLEQAEEQLRTMLREAGLDIERLDPSGTWNVFKLFAADAVEGRGPEPDDDMCLFEYGVYDWSDGKGPRFNWNLCRQFIIYDDGEYDRMDQLRCDLYFEVTPQLELLQPAGIWSGPDLVDWATRVETQEGFDAVTELTPVESRVGQAQV